MSSAYRDESQWIIDFDETISSNGWIKRPPISVDGQHYIFRDNYSLPSQDIIDAANSGDEIHQSIKTKDENYLIFVSEIMHRGLGVLPGDEVKAVDQSGREVKGSFGFYVHPDFHNFDEFKRHISDKIPGQTTWTLARGLYDNNGELIKVTQVTPSEMIGLIDNAFELEEFAYLNDLVKKRKAQRAEYRKNEASKQLGELILPNLDDIDLDAGLPEII